MEHPYERQRARRTRAIRVNCTIYDREIAALINTTSGISTINPAFGEWCKEKGAEIIHGPAPIFLHQLVIHQEAYREVRSMYTVLVAIELGGVPYTVPLIVVANQAPSLVFGLDFLSVAGAQFSFRPSPSPRRAAQRQRRRRRHRWRVSDKGIGESDSGQSSSDHRN